METPSTSSRRLVSAIDELFFEPFYFLKFKNELLQNLILKLDLLMVLAGLMWRNNIVKSNEDEHDSL